MQELKYKIIRIRTSKIGSKIRFKTIRDYEKSQHNSYIKVSTAASKFSKQAFSDKAKYSQHKKN